jgi:hypothetical protein
MQRFHEDQRQDYDLRAAIVWDIQRSLNEQTAGRSYSSQNVDIQVTVEMAICLDLMLRCSMNERSVSRLPPRDELLRQLQDARPRYVEMLERYPDGRTDTDRQADTLT